MLEQLVREIQAGGTLETNTLAARWGVSPQLIEAMLDHLQRSGMIRAYISCSDGCQGCNIRDACDHSTAGNIRLWQSISSD